MKRLLALLAMLALVALGIVALGRRTAEPGVFVPPDGANVTFYRAAQPEVAPPLVISASVEPGFMRPFLLAFQRHHPTVAIAYIDTRSSAFLAQALRSCAERAGAADLYVSASADPLVRLANRDCAQDLPAAVAAAAPANAAWRNQVIAFTVEPAAFVFARRAADETAPRPTSHTALLEWLRRRPGRIGTYDIEDSADGYAFAASDSRQPSLYGRLLEALGRADIRLYCCSNVMVDAVSRGDIGFAYNVQTSYAYAAQRAGSRIAVVIPSDYQAIQTVAMMVPRGARTRSTAGAFAAFLVSDEARGLARRALAPPGLPAAAAARIADGLLAKASVTPVLLGLQDRGRRAQLVGEWRAAIVDPPLALPVPPPKDLP
jgi:iron(III) transport system substrate-binding protein